MEKILVLILILVFSFSAVSAQEQSQTFPLIPKEQIGETTCEDHQSRLISLGQYTSLNELIIIVSHTGRNQKVSFGKRRLHNAKTVF